MTRFPMPGWRGAALGAFAAILLYGASGVLAVPPADEAVQRLGRTDADMKVYKTATCGCCESWVKRMRARGFTVEASDVPRPRLIEIKQKLGITRDTASCHTAVIDGYVVEGHVPARDIRQLLHDRPDGVHGLAVPGMPVGSPGMEMGGRQDPYDVIGLGAEGEGRIFSSYPRD